MPFVAVQETEPSGSLVVGSDPDSSIKSLRILCYLSFVFFDVSLEIFNVKDIIFSIRSWNPVFVSIDLSCVLMKCYLVDCPELPMQRH